MRIDFLPDRLPKAELELAHPDAAGSLRARWSIMMDNSRELVAWVGIANANRSGATLFLPHGSPSTDMERRTLAPMLMQAILRFAKERGRSGDASTDQGLNHTALLADIATDYRDFGLYAHRERIQMRKAGKPDWPRTINSEVAFMRPDGTLFYIDFKGTRPTTFTTNVIALIQSEVIREIASIHGWWLAEHFGAREIPSPVKNIVWPRQVWSKLLLAARVNLYNARAVRLANMLIAYLENEQHSGVGQVVCGIADFSTMWEEMLRKVLPDVDNVWNSLLPGPAYIDAADNPAPSGRMEMDIVVKRGTALLIADAKYYRATSVTLAPGWADIVKQFYYQKSLETVEEASKYGIRNIFLFPSDRTDTSPFQSVEMRSGSGHPIEAFPPIGCQYISVADVISAYCNRRLLEDVRWMDKWLESAESELI